MPEEDIVQPAQEPQEPQEPEKPQEPVLREFGDVAATRDSLFERVQSSLEEKFPISNERYTLRIAGAQYQKPKKFTNDEQKRALMRGQTLGWNLVGGWELVDNASGKVVDKTGKRLVAQVPYITDRGTFIFNGNEYTVASQMRLRPGVYSRIKDNGIIEAHFNVKGGTGRSFRVYMEPETGVFRANVGQANLKLYPLLKAMGIEDRQLNDVWGRDLLQANVAASDPRAVQRAYSKMVGEHADETPEKERDTDEIEQKAASARAPKSDVNYVMLGTFQNCGRCSNFDGANGCSKVQGFIADMGWCMLWQATMRKYAEQEQNRHRAHFMGELVCDDSRPGDEWAYLKVHKGLPEACFAALKDQGIDCTAQHDLPHISVLRTWEVNNLKAKYGKKWKRICGEGRRFPFSLQNAIVDLDPDSWAEMDRVWFLETKSPELRAYRKSLGFEELPRGDDTGEQFQFHITVAVHKADQPRGSSKLDSLFGDDDTAKIKKASAWLYNTLDQAFLIKSGKADLVNDAWAEKLADVLDMSPPTEELEENEQPADLIERQQLAVRDLRGNPAAERAKIKGDMRTLKKQVSMKERIFSLEELKAMLPMSVLKTAYKAFVGRDRFYDETLTKQASEDKQYGPGLRAVFEAMELDPNTTEMTLGRPVKNVSPELIVDVTKKLMQISRREAETDDRDSLAFQRVYGPEDLFSERIARDAGGMSRKLLWKATSKGTVKNLPSGALSPQLRLVLLKSGLGAPLEEVNPLEIFDQQVRVTRMGEGGMPSLDSVPDEARSVQPSHFGVIDPIRAPEGMKIGVDSRVTHRTYKGSDGSIYVDMLDVKNGKPTRISAENMAKSVVAFPGELATKSKEVRAMIKGKRVAYVDRKEVDYELPNTSHMFTATSNMVPLVSAIKGGRLLMGAKMATQALPLRTQEAPFVQNLYDDGSGKSFEDMYGERMGAVRADGAGTVTDINKTTMTVKYNDGRKQEYDLYNNFPFNRKTYLHNTPSVKIGDPVAKGTLLAKSNFTDDKGAVSTGLNLRVGYLPYRGYNADDAIVISESAANKLSSEHMYTTKYREADNYETGRKEFLSLFPGTFDKTQMATVGSKGVVKPNTVVNYGDPLVLAVAKRKPTGGGMIRTRKELYSDVSEVWEHESPGVVTDVDKTKDGYKVSVKAYSPMNIGDKLSNRYGGKGVVSKILSDDKMPHDTDGNPLELMLNPLGIVSRTNPAQLVEVALGKVAKKTGHVYKLPGFSDENYIDLAKRELQKHGLSDTEDVYDPTSGRKIPKVMTGYAYMMKLHHMAEPKSSGRDVGSYTSEGIPAGGGQDGSKRIGMGEMTALISHGATEVIRDAKLVRGQRNDEFWRALRLGYTPPSPKVPMIYEKFISYLQGSGINLRKQGETTHLLAMTDKDTTKMSAGALTTSDTVSGDKLEPVKGGLFDVGLTGGHGGTRWTHVDLAEPMPNPVMEEPIRRMLGLTKPQLSKIIAGREDLNGETGPKALLSALKRIKVDSAIEHYGSQMREGTGAKRDNAIKVLGYMRTLKKSGQKPTDLMVSKVPVLPPNFRPITSFNKMTMVSDPNYMYLDMMKANDDLADLHKAVGDEGVGDERLHLYNAYKAVTGLGDPVGIKTQDKKAKGLLAHVFGGSPKFGMYQRRVLGAAVDTVGRGVITPNPSLGMDQVGMPEDKAWVLFRPFVVRNLVRRGLGAMEAAHSIENETDSARRALVEEMNKRPVLINRAPVLHRYGMMAAWAKPVKGSTLQVPPITTSGFNADFDGDAMNYHVPVSKAAVEEAVNKMMPSRNLLSTSDFDVHYFPRQEFLHGLHLASTSKKKNAKHKTFMSKADIIKAYRRGELSIDDLVQTTNK